VARGNGFTGKANPLPSHLVHPARPSESTKWVRIMLDRGHWRRLSHATGNFRLRFDIEHSRRWLIAGGFRLLSKTFHIRQGKGKDPHLWRPFMLRLCWQRNRWDALIWWSYPFHGCRTPSASSFPSLPWRSNKQTIKDSSHGLVLYCGGIVSGSGNVHVPSDTPHAPLPTPNWKFSRTVVASVWPTSWILLYRYQV